MSITRKFTLTDCTGEANTLTLSETTCPQAISITIFEPKFQCSSEIIISRSDWEKLLSHLSRYSTEFTWTPAPTPEPAQPEVAL